MINCKESTILTLKKEEKKITLKERIELFFHLLICKYCRAFDKQSAWLNAISKSIEGDAPFTAEEKQDLEGRLKESNQ